MDLKDLWIGDRLWVEGETGTFEGIDRPTGMAKVKVGKEIRLARATELSLKEPEVIDPVMERLNAKLGIREQYKKKFSLKRSAEFETRLDLHMVNFPEYKRSTAGEPELAFQLRKAEAFLAQAIDLKVHRVVLVHGYGDGKLRDALIGLLKGYEQIDRCDVHQDGAALELWFDFTA